MGGEDQTLGQLILTAEPPRHDSADGEENAWHSRLDLQEERIVVRAQQQMGDAEQTLLPPVWDCHVCARQTGIFNSQADKRPK